MLHEHDQEIFDCKRHPLIPIKQRKGEDGVHMNDVEKCPCCGGYKYKFTLNIDGNIDFECVCCGYFWRKTRRAPHKNYDGPIWAEKKEVPTMQVTYNGFTGGLVKLERRAIPENFIMDRKPAIVYDLSLYDSEKQVTHSFACVKLEDVKFLGGVVTFGG